MHPEKNEEYCVVARARTGFQPHDVTNPETDGPSEPGRRVVTRRMTVILALLTTLVVSGPSVAANPNTFVHTATPGNTVSFGTYLDNPLLDDPNVVPIVTQNWNPGGVGGTYNDHPIGVYFDYGFEEKWLIVNIDESPMPIGASFNVHVFSYGPRFFAHEAVASNTSSFFTTLSHPLLDESPEAMAHLTQFYSGNNDHHPYLLAYGDDATLLPPGWHIVNSNAATMPSGGPGPIFFVAVLASSPSAFRHDADLTNIELNWTTIDSPLLNGHPEAIVLVTAAEPDAATAEANPHEIGVWYTGTNWAIFNQDGAPFPNGASFNVFVANGPYFLDGFESGDLAAWSSSVP